MSKNDKATLPRLPLLALFAGAVFIALAPIFVRLADSGPTAIGFWRVFLPIPVLLVWAVLERRSQPAALPVPRYARRAMVLAGVAFALDLFVWHLSIQFTSVANATLLPNLMPVVVAAVGYFFLGERYSRRFLLGLAIAVGGAGVLMGGTITVDPGQLVGDLLGLTTAAFYASYVLLVKRARAAVGTGQIMLVSAVITAVLLLPLSIALGETVLPATPGGWGAVIGLALISHAAGQGMIAWSLAHLPAAFSTVGLLVQPLGAALFAAALLGEPLTVWKIAGGIIIIGGILLARKGS
jgi:drug/metabolite transporter (DMT)-like permease